MAKPGSANCSMRIELQSAWQTNRTQDAGSSAFAVTVLHTLLLVPGVFVTLGALSVYPLLDSRQAMAFLLSGFLLPFAALIVSIMRKREGHDAKILRKIYVCASLVLVLFGLFLFANGKLDGSPARSVQATVLEKILFRGRVTQTRLYVSSARPGRSREDLLVSSGVFDRAVVGKAVTVELHDGYFGLSWYGRIFPD
jgi:hypothetical protein